MSCKYRLLAFGEYHAQCVQPEEDSCPYAKLEKLHKELIEAYRLAKTENSAERLAGNILKETYWRGELVAIRRVANLLDIDLTGSEKKEDNRNG